MKKAMLSVGLLVLVLAALGAAEQVTRQEFDNLALEVRALRAQIVTLETRTKKLEELKPRLQSKAARVKPEDGQRILEFSHLFPFGPNAATEIIGVQVFGTLIIRTVGPHPKDPNLVLCTGDCDGSGQRIICVMEVPSAAGLGVTRNEVWQVRGNVTAAQIEQAGRVVALRLYLTDVERAWIRNARETATTTFNATGLSGLGSGR